jgi:hypothetical protein
MLRATRPDTNSATAPALSARTTMRRATVPGSSPAWWPARQAAGREATASSMTASWSAPELAAALPGRSRPARASPVASSKQNIGWKP